VYLHYYFYTLYLLLNIKICIEILNTVISGIIYFLVLVVHWYITDHVSGRYLSDKISL